MSKMIQIRHVPEKLHRRLKARAAQLGMTLSDYLLREIEQVAQRPTIGETLERIRCRGPARVSPEAAAAVRAERDAR
jgi:plasmid stability protein